MRRRASRRTARVLAFADVSAFFTQAIHTPIQGELPRLLGVGVLKTAWPVSVMLLASSLAVPISALVVEIVDWQIPFVATAIASVAGRAEGSVGP